MIKILLLIVITAALYINTLSNKLVWDDHLFLESWPDIRSFENLPKILLGSAPEGQGKIFRPIRGVLYVLNYKLWGANPYFYHLQALFMHVGITVLIYLITQQIVSSIKYQVNTPLRWRLRKKSIIHNTYSIIPFVTALLFGLHPIHTETINYISASMETWGTLFFFISFYLYLRVRVWGSLVFAFLAFFTYEMTLTLPLLILLYEVCFKFSSPKLLKRIFPYLGTAFGADAFLLTEDFYQEF